MRRGDLVTIAIEGDSGKPWPALVIQCDKLDEHAIVTVLPVTSVLVAAPLFGITIRPSAENGLQERSQVMADKVVTVQRDKVGPTFGRIDADSMVEVERSLAVFRKNTEKTGGLGCQALS
jgi:mRNA interferase MazF